MTTCTALTPVDSQVLDLIGKLNAQLTKPGVVGLRSNAVGAILAATRNSTLEGAVGILDALGCGDAIFYCGGCKWNVRDALNESWFPDLQGRMATELKLWFWGGPPANVDWYEGTLQTLVDDRIMFEIHHRGVSRVVDLIGLDLS